MLVIPVFSAFLLWVGEVVHASRSKSCRVQQGDLNACSLVGGGKNLSMMTDPPTEIIVPKDISLQALPGSTLLAWRKARVILYKPGVEFRSPPRELYLDNCFVLFLRLHDSRFPLDKMEIGPPEHRVLFVYSHDAIHWTAGMKEMDLRLFTVETWPIRNKNAPGERRDAIHFIVWSKGFANHGAPKITFPLRDCDGRPCVWETTYHRAYVTVDEAEIPLSELPGVVKATFYREFDVVAQDIAEMMGPDYGAHAGMQWGDTVDVWNVGQ